MFKHKAKCLNGVGGSGAIQNPGGVTITRDGTIILLVAMVGWDFSVVTNVKTESGWLNVAVSPYSPLIK